MPFNLGKLGIVKKIAKRDPRSDYKSAGNPGRNLQLVLLACADIGWHMKSKSTTCKSISGPLLSLTRPLGSTKDENSNLPSSTYSLQLTTYYILLAIH